MRERGANGKECAEVAFVRDKWSRKGRRNRRHMRQTLLFHPTHWFLSFPTIITPPVFLSLHNSHQKVHFYLYFLCPSTSFSPNFYNSSPSFGSLFSKRGIVFSKFKQRRHSFIMFLFSFFFFFLNFDFTLILVKDFQKICTWICK